MTIWTKLTALGFVIGTVTHTGARRLERIGG
jgi:hypothetical protein